LEKKMIHGTFMGVLAILFGVLVLAIPELLRWLIGILFIAMGAFAIYAERKSLQNGVSSSHPEEKNAGGVISGPKI
jgi:cytochrome c biogenesis protein CcdA